MKRYGRDQRIRGGKLQTARTIMLIRRANEFGLIPTRKIYIKESQRLDHLAHVHLGDSSLWWILAGLSNIGWGLQVPAGTIIRIPLDINAIKTIVG
jgi:hypothetical protein